MTWKVDIGAGILMKESSIKAIDTCQDSGKARLIKAPNKFHVLFEWPLLKLIVWFQHSINKICCLDQIKFIGEDTMETASYFM